MKLKILKVFIDPVILIIYNVNKHGPRRDKLYIMKTCKRPSFF